MGDFKYYSMRWNETRGASSITSPKASKQLLILPGGGREGPSGWSLWKVKQYEEVKTNSQVSYLAQKGPLESMKWRRQWHPTPVLLPGKSHGQRSLVGCRPWGHEELDTTEWLHFHFSLSCIGEGNGNPLQCSCLENPRDKGAWLAAIYGVTQSRTRLRQLSSSSSREYEDSTGKHRPYV